MSRSVAEGVSRPDTYLSALIELFICSVSRSETDFPFPRSYSLTMDRGGEMLRTPALFFPLGRETEPILRSYPGNVPGPLNAAIIIRTRACRGQTRRVALGRRWHRD